MIVQCTECSTKFRLDDSKVSDAGVKVRCAKCRHIFVVHREPPRDEPDLDSMLQGLGGDVAAAPAAVSAETAQPAGPSIEMDDDLLRTLAGAESEPADDGLDFSLDATSPTDTADMGGGQEFELEIPLPGGPAAEPGEAVRFEPPSFQEFSFDDADATPADFSVTSGASVTLPSMESPAPETVPDSFSFGEAAAPGDSFSFPSTLSGGDEISFDEPAAAGGGEPSAFTFEPFPEQPVAPAVEAPSFQPEEVLPAPEPEADSFVFGDSPAPAVGGDDFTFTPTPPEPAVQPSAVFADAGDFTFGASSEPSAKGSLRTDDAELRALVAKGEGLSPAEPLVFSHLGGASESDDELPPLAIPSRKRGGSSSAVWGLVLLLLLLAAAAGGGWWYVQQNGLAAMEGVLSAVGVDMAPRYELQGVKGVYARGIDGVELFVVQGQVKNLSRFARDEIQVRATLYAADNRPLVKKTAFCGNPLSLPRLADLPLIEVEKAMASRFGEGLSNLDVKGGESAPFTVVFIAPPVEAADFGIEVAGSVLAQNKK